MFAIPSGLAWAPPTTPLHYKRIRPWTRSSPLSHRPQSFGLSRHPPCRATLTEPNEKLSSFPTDTGRAGLPPSFFENVPETLNPIQLNVVGDLPSYLATSSYYLNGPGVFSVPHKDGQLFAPEHWFDGLSIVHAFCFDADKNAVMYRSRMTADATERAIRSVPKDNYRAIQFSKQSHPGNFIARQIHALAPMTTDPELGDAPFITSVSLEEIPTRGILNARTDANVIHKLDPETLEVTDRYDFSYFNPELNKTLCPSHGILDQETGEYYNLMADYSPVKTEYKVFRINPSGTADVLAKHKDFTYYTHSFALTKSYLIMVMCPVQVKLFPLLRSKSFTESCAMRPDTPTNFIVVNRQSGDIEAVYEHEQFFTFHNINAFEQDGNILLDLSLYRDNRIMKDLRIDNLTKPGEIAQGRPVRFTLSNIAEAGTGEPSSKRKASSRVLVDAHFDFAMVAPRVRQASQKYMYGVSDNGGQHFSGGVAKVDVHTGGLLSHASSHEIFGEPMFVPDPNGIEEDEGCVIVLAVDKQREYSALLVLDARSMTEIARAEVPMRLPPCFHGSFHS